MIWVLNWLPNSQCILFWQLIKHCANGLQLLYCGDGMELRPFVMYDGNHVYLFGYSGEDRFSDEESDHFETEFSKSGQLVWINYLVLKVY